MLEIRKFEIDDIAYLWRTMNVFLRDQRVLGYRPVIATDHNQDLIRDRLTAILDGQFVGFSQFWELNNKCFVSLGVLPEARSHVTEDDLLEKMVTQVQNMNLEISQKFSFQEIKIKNKAALSRLEEQDFQPFLFQELEQRLKLKNIRFATLCDFSDTPETRENLYNLVRQSVEDDTGFEGEFETLEQFNDFIWKIYWDARQHWILAVDGSKFVAMAGATPRDSETWHAHLTGVTRSHRGRGLAQVVKAKSTQLARDSGAKYIETSNDANNVAMLAVNRKIGFVHVGDRYLLETVVD